MKQVFMFLLALLPLVGNAEERTYANLAPFHELKAHFNFQVEYVVSQERYAKVEAPESYFEYIDVTSRGGVLTLNLRNRLPSRLMRTAQSIRVTVYGPSLRSIELNGACRFSTHACFAEDEVELDLNGASSIDALRVDCKELHIDLSGASRLGLGGRCAVIEADVDGASAMDLNMALREFGPKSLSMEVSGASKAEVDLKGCLNRSSLEISAASQVRLAGEATDARVELSGMAKFQAEDFEVRNMDIECSGACKAWILVTDQVRGDISGASKVYCKGGARYSGRLNGFITEE